MTDFFDKLHVIKTYLESITNSSGHDKIDVDVVKENIENAFLSRLSHQFEIVNKKSEADIIINADITEYFWTEEDPVDLVFSPIAAAADAAKSEPYARMQALFIIYDGRTGKELWNQSVSSTITKGTMTKEEAYGLTYERLGKNLIKKLFKKRRRR
jgi:hypothetical protein